MSISYDTTHFNSYDEALKYFNITGQYLKVIKHPKSLERVIQNGNVIYCIGIGKTISPGKPGGNQQLHSQLPIFQHSCVHPYTFPAFYENNGRIQYMGSYLLRNYKKKMSFTGFLYFEFMFHRQSKHYMVEYNKC